MPGVTWPVEICLAYETEASEMFKFKWPDYSYLSACGADCICLSLLNQSSVLCGEMVALRGKEIYLFFTDGLQQCILRA